MVIAHPPKIEDFLFVNSSNSSIPADQETRKIIRKQAMNKAAYERKKRGTWGKRNQLQYPVRSNYPSELESTHAESSQPDYVRCDDSTLVDAARFAIEPDTAEKAVCTQSEGGYSSCASTSKVPAPMSSVGYEAMRIQYCFDILDLSALITVHAGRATARALFKDPPLLWEVLGCRQPSYLAYVPSLFGHSTCLDDAARCLAARVGCWIANPSQPPSSSVLNLYSRALLSLQAALNDPNVLKRTDVLCAMKILALFELFKSPVEQSWVSHIAGATSLMKLRGPNYYKTEFELSMFIAQVGPTYAECLLDNQSCFLEQDEWLAVFRATVGNSSTIWDRSEIVIKLWICVCAVPGLFKEVQEVVCSSRRRDDADMVHLFARIKERRIQLLEWWELYHDFVLQAERNTSPGSTQAKSRLAKRFETVGVYLVNLIIVNRLMTALTPHLGMPLENEAHDLANRLVTLRNEAVAMNPRAGLFMEFKLIVAKAVLATTDEWRAAIENEGPQNKSALSSEGLPTGKMIAKRVFEHWCELKGRKTSRSISSSKFEPSEGQRIFRESITIGRHNKSLSQGSIISLLTTCWG